MTPSPVLVRIRDFQSLEDVDIEIRGFTCITGPTNIGKSAIIRAISGALLNSPVIGDVRKGRKYSSVTLDGGDWSMKWEKGKTISRTWIPANADRPLTAVGRGQLDEVAAFGFRSVSVGPKKVQPWLATQFDPVFLMRETGPAITDFLSEVSRLKVLQDGVIINARARRRAMDLFKIRDGDAEKLREKLKATIPLIVLLKVEKDLDAQIESIHVWEEKVSLGRKFQSSIQATEQAIAKFEAHKDIRLPTDHAEKRFHALQKMQIHWVDLEQAAASVRDIIGIKEISPPEDSGADELERLGTLRKFFPIPGMQRSVAVLDPADELEISTGPSSEEIEKMVRGAQLMTSIAQLEDGIEALTGSMDVPEAPEVPERLLRGARILAGIQQVQPQKGALEDRLERVESELDAVEEELALIPVCPACERPVSKAHSHPASA